MASHPSQKQRQVCQALSSRGVNIICSAGVDSVKVSFRPSVNAFGSCAGARQKLYSRKIRAVACRSAMSANGRPAQTYRPDVIPSLSVKPCEQFRTNSLLTCAEWNKSRAVLDQFRSGGPALWDEIVGLHKHAFVYNLFSLRGSCMIKNP